MWILKTRTVARKSWIRDLNLRKEVLTFWKFDKIFTDLYRFTYKFGRAELTNPRRGEWTCLNFAYAVTIEIHIKK